MDFIMVPLIMGIITLGIYKPLETHLAPVLQHLRNNLQSAQSMNKEDDRSDRERQKSILFLHSGFVRCIVLLRSVP